jgi:hypothetical protein
MQVAMWVVFAGALGLAQLVVRQRQLTPIVLDAPTRLGPLWVRLPKGWGVAAGPDSPGNEIQVEDPEQPRDLTILVQRLPDGQRGGQEADQPGAGTQPIFFKGLNRAGVMVGFRQKVRTAEGATTSEELMLALTDLPSGHEVEILLRQSGVKMGAAERQLLETVANEITWAGPLPPTKRLPPLPRGPVL